MKKITLILALILFSSAAAADAVSVANTCGALIGKGAACGISTDALSRRCAQKIDELTIGMNDERTKALKQFMLSATASTSYQAGGGNEPCSSIQSSIAEFGAAPAKPSAPRLTESELTKSALAGGVTVIVFLVVFAALYLTPTGVAYWRDAKRFNAIVATNLLLGWTVIGWIGALIWALGADRES